MRSPSCLLNRRRGPSISISTLFGDPEKPTGEFVIDTPITSFHPSYSRTIGFYGSEWFRDTCRPLLSTVRTPTDTPSPTRPTRLHPQTIAITPSTTTRRRYLNLRVPERRSREVVTFPHWTRKKKKLTGVLVRT